MYRNHFGLKHHILDKEVPVIWNNPQFEALSNRFEWLLTSPGIGLLTGAPGVGKTLSLNHIVQQLNPHQYQVIYTPETDFGRYDLYRNLAIALGLEPTYRRSHLWHCIKEHLLNLHEQAILPIWIIDEAQLLPNEFFLDLPAFLNFKFDSKMPITIWLVGYPELSALLNRQPYEAIRSRLHVRFCMEALSDREQFKQLIEHAFQSAGSQGTLISDTGYEILHQSSKARPRQAGQILRYALKRATEKGLNHIPDELITEAAEMVIW